MHSISTRTRQPLDMAQLHSIFDHTLALGNDMDGRGLHWRLPVAVGPAQRLAFALAVYFTGGLTILTDADRGFLCVEKIALALAVLKRARASGCSYRCGHAHGVLHEALGYSADDSAGFRLIEATDVRSAEGFIKGYGEHVVQSLEADVLRIVRRQPPQHEQPLLAALRHFIGDRATRATEFEQPL